MRDVFECVAASLPGRWLLNYLAVTARESFSSVNRFLVKLLLLTEGAIPDPDLVDILDRLKPYFSCFCLSVGLVPGLT